MLRPSYASQSDASQRVIIRPYSVADEEAVIALWAATGSVRPNVMGKWLPNSGQAHPDGLTRASDRAEAKDVN